jgi:hypothetical protein
MWKPMNSSRSEIIRISQGFPYLSVHSFSLLFSDFSLSASEEEVSLVNGKQKQSF